MKLFFTAKPENRTAHLVDAMRDPTRAVRRADARAVDKKDLPALVQAIVAHEATAPTLPRPCTIAFLQAVKKRYGASSLTYHTTLADLWPTVHAEICADDALWPADKPPQALREAMQQTPWLLAGSWNQPQQVSAALPLQGTQLAQRLMLTEPRSPIAFHLLKAKLAPDDYEQALQRYLSRIEAASPSTGVKLGGLPHAARRAAVQQFPEKFFLVAKNIKGLSFTEDELLAMFARTVALRPRAAPAALEVLFTTYAPRQHALSMPGEEQFFALLMRLAHTPHLRLVRCLRLDSWQWHWLPAGGKRVALARAAACTDPHGMYRAYGSVLSSPAERIAVLMHTLLMGGDARGLSPGTSRFDGLQFDDAPRLTAGVVQRLMQSVGEMESLGVPAMVFGSAAQQQRLSMLAERYPTLNLVLVPHTFVGADAHATLLASLGAAIGTERLHAVTSALAMRLQSALSDDLTPLRQVRALGMFLFLCTMARVPVERMEAAADTLEVLLKLPDARLRHACIARLCGRVLNPSGPPEAYAAFVAGAKRVGPKGLPAEALLFVVALASSPHASALQHPHVLRLLGYRPLMRNGQAARNLLSDLLRIIDQSLTDPKAYTLLHDVLQGPSAADLTGILEDALHRSQQAAAALAQRDVSAWRAARCEVQRLRTLLSAHALYAQARVSAAEQACANLALSDLSLACATCAKVLSSGRLKTLARRAATIAEAFVNIDPALSAERIQDLVGKVRAAVARVGDAGDAATWLDELLQQLQQRVQPTGIHLRAPLLSGPDLKRAVDGVYASDVAPFLQNAVRDLAFLVAIGAPLPPHASAWELSNRVHESLPIGQKIAHFGEDFLAFVRTVRAPQNLLTYFTHLKQSDNTQVWPVLERAVVAAMAGPQAWRTMRRTQSAQLKLMGANKTYVTLLQTWEAGSDLPIEAVWPDAPPAMRGFRLRDSDTFSDMLNQGTEVSSCLAVNGSFAPALVSRMVDGAKRLLLIVDPTGVIVARALARLMSDTDGTPRIFVERPYRRMSLFSGSEAGIYLARFAALRAAALATLAFVRDDDSGYLAESQPSFDTHLSMRRSVAPDYWDSQHNYSLVAEPATLTHLWQVKPFKAFASGENPTPSAKS